MMDGSGRLLLGRARSHRKSRGDQNSEASHELLVSIFNTNALWRIVQACAGSMILASAHVRFALAVSTDRRNTLS
jgi:hypothetical protein